MRLGTQTFEVNQIRWSYIQREVPGICSETPNFAVDLVGNFAMGSQQRVENIVYNRSKVVSYKPATNWDALKKMLLDWIPSLKFGWLVPKMEPVVFHYDVAVTNKYVNVIPLDPSYETKTHIEYMTGRPYEPIPAFDWLSAEPPTQPEIEQARATAIECAEKMAHAYLWR